MTALLTETPTARSANALDRKTLWLWAASFLGLPIGGYIAHLIVGPVDATWVAVAAGAITGAIVGAGQWLALRRIGIDARWILATAFGLALGVAITYLIFGYETSIADLATLGAISGLAIGVAQFPLLAQGPLATAPRTASVWWAPITAAAWAIGWTVSASIGIDVESRWAVFGASGAIVAAVITGLGLWMLVRAARSVPA